MTLPPKFEKYRDICSRFISGKVDDPRDLDMVYQFRTCELIDCLAALEIALEALSHIKDRLPHHKEDSLWTEKLAIEIGDRVDGAIDKINKIGGE